MSNYVPNRKENSGKKGCLHGLSSGEDRCQGPPYAPLDEQVAIRELTLDAEGRVVSVSEFVHRIDTQAEGLGGVCLAPERLCWYRGSSRMRRCQMR